jgi:23S rRNA (guanosine2251-2'-O)-methyltransferase
MLKKGTFYIYGKKPIEEQLLQNPKNVIRVFISDVVSNTSQEFTLLKQYSKEHNIPINSISKHKLKEYVGDVNTQGIIALVKEAFYTEYEDWLETYNPEELTSVLVLDRIEDTHNFGAILRTAAATGVSAVFVAKDHQAPINGTVFKTSAGALTRIPIVRVSNINQMIDRLKKMKFWTAAIDIDTENRRTESLFDQTFDTSMAFVLGSEGKGIAEKTRERCDYVISIPMENDVESLNVSVAGAVVMYEWKRQVKNMLK